MTSYSQIQDFLNLIFHLDSLIILMRLHPHQAINKGKGLVTLYSQTQDFLNLIFHLDSLIILIQLHQHQAIYREKGLKTLYFLTQDSQNQISLLIFQTTHLHLTTSMEIQSQLLHHPIPISILQITMPHP
ncbi:unnamed protein product [Meganyctiphanes norvegica]|uniref:Uncharacterized protein n=1 Tax=Meganyctiphanes norvegica TaxID=48144 RepID=A0AAV2SU99_MEGNR